MNTIDHRLHWIAASGYGWQLGEQGMIESIVETIGLRKGVFVEVGAGDGGTNLPLTCDKLIGLGWRGILIESNPVNAELLRQRKGKADSVIVIEKSASVENINDLVPSDADVVVIDVDSIDYHLWEQLRHRPAVVMVEHHDAGDPRVPKDQPSVPPLDVLGKQSGGGYNIQANHLALDIPAVAKGYTCVARTRFNSIYVLDGFVPKLLHKCETSVGVISQPRIGFSDMEDCVRKAVTPLGMDVFRYNSVASWEKGLTAVLEEAVRRNLEFAITLDYDSVFTAADIMRLVEYVKNDPTIDAVFPVQANRHTDMPQCFEQGLDYTKELTDRAFGHFGCTIIRIASLKKLPTPWFWSMPDPNTGRWDSELTSDTDITFWRSCKEQGWRVCQANRVMIGHLEMCVKWLTPEGVAWQAAPNYMKHGRPTKVGFNPALYDRPPRVVMVPVKKENRDVENADRAVAGAGSQGAVPEVSGGGDAQVCRGDRESGRAEEPGPVLEEVEANNPTCERNGCVVQSV